MKNKLKSDLFSKFEISSKQYRTLVGGFYTSMSDDTNASGGGYDIEFETLDGGGESTGTDVHNTGTGSRDQPSDCLTNSFSQF